MIGVTDHAFTRKLPDSRKITSLEKYLDHMKNLQSTQNNIVLKIGIEIDVHHWSGTDPAKLPFSVLEQLDYVLFEYVGNLTGNRLGGRSIQEIVAVRNKFPMPTGLAHNNLQEHFEGNEEEIASIMAENDIFLDIKQSKEYTYQPEFHYYRKFSPQLLEALARREVKVVIGTDSHTGENLGNLDDATKFIEEHKLCYHEMVR